MKLTEQDMKKLWQQSDERSNAASGDCLSEDLLLRAGLNELNESERSQIAEHVIGCPDCLEQYRIVRATGDWAKNTAEEFAIQPTTSAIKPTLPRPNGWRSFFEFAGFTPARAVLAAVLLMAAAVSVWTVKLQLENKNLQAKLHQEQEKRALAAARQANESQQETEQLLASNQSLTAENFRLKENLTALSKPQLETPIIDVDPANLNRGVSESINTATNIDVPAKASFFTVILHLPGEQAGQFLLIELIDRKTGSTLWSGQQKQTHSPNLTLTLAKNLCPAGKYRIRISSLSGQRKQLIDHYDIQVNYLNAQ